MQQVVHIHDSLLMLIQKVSSFKACNILLNILQLSEDAKDFNYEISFEPIGVKIFWGDLLKFQ